MELTRVESTGSTARYAVDVETSDAKHRAHVEIDTGTGRVEFATWDPSSPPAWLSELATNLAKGLLRDAGAGRPWPRRVHRWRAERDPAHGTR
ncbi:MAG: hypothetical protein R3A78_10600 [Polyangiales bacterium]